MIGNTRTAVIDRLRDLPGVVSLYELAPIVYAGHDQHDVVACLFRLQDEGVIELLPGNRLRRLRFPA